MKRVLWVLVGPIALVMAQLAPPSASAAPADVIVANWQMDEITKANGLVDSSDNHFNGTIGDQVMIHQPTGDGGWAFQFPGPHFAPYNPEKLALVEDVGDSLDPGPNTRSYAVTIRFKTTAPKPNIVQKGQNNVRGGFMKLVLKNGWPRCHFEDGNQNISATGFVSTSVPKVNDGRWHTLRCERSEDGTRVTLDAGTPNEETRVNHKVVGTIDNSRPFMIGGKLDCNREGVTCDFFAGQLDWVKIEN
jgi:hypothetical protein